MPLTLRMNLKGIKEIKAKLTREALVLPIAADAIRELTEIGEREAKGNAPRDMGGLVNDIASEVRPLQGRVFITGSSRGVKAAAVEFGRGSGERAPSASDIAGWASRHGFGTRQAVFLLARAIGRRGIKGRFFIRKARLHTRRQMPQVIEKMGRKAEAIWRS